MDNSSKFSADVREQYPLRWKASESIAPKIGCNPVTLLEWVKRAEIDSSQRPGVTTESWAR